jgi:hypothetical protein
MTLALPKRFEENSLQQIDAPLAAKLSVSRSGRLGPDIAP